MQLPRPQDLLKIIDKLQALEGPDRGVDIMISQAFLGGTAAMYTADIYSALTLADENAEYMISRRVVTSQDGTITDVFWSAAVGSGFIRHTRAGAAVAVCIAAIRDRIANGR